MKRITIFFFFSFLVLVYSPSLSAADTMLNIKIFLQGPFNSSIMSNELRKENLLPLSQPYNIEPWNYNGNEHVEKIPEGVVDWVIVELSEDINMLHIAAKKAAFLTVDGIITSLDGKSPLTFNKTNKEYYIVILHRNHIPVMSSKPINLNEAVYYDFTTGREKAFGNTLTELGSGTFGMISGDGDSNGEVDNLDFKAIADDLLKTGYLNADLDMNGVVNILDYKKTNINLSKKSSIPLTKSF